MKLTALGGQPAMLTVLIPNALLMPTQSVGFGFAAGIFPKAEQEPIQTTAAALEVTSLAT